MDPITVVSAALVAGLLAAYRNTMILGAAILGFSVVGIGLIVGSALTTGWWQAFQLAIGTSLLIVGTVELGILGLLRHVLGEDESGRQNESSKRRITISSGDFSATFNADDLNDSRISAAIGAFMSPVDPKLSANLSQSGERAATPLLDGLIAQGRATPAANPGPVPPTPARDAHEEDPSLSAGLAELRNDERG